MHPKVTIVVSRSHWRCMSCHVVHKPAISIDQHLRSYHLQLLSPVATGFPSSLPDRQSVMSPVATYCTSLLPGQRSVVSPMETDCTSLLPGQQSVMSPIVTSIPSSLPVARSSLFLSSEHEFGSYSDGELEVTCARLVLRKKTTDNKSHTKVESKTGQPVPVDDITKTNDSRIVHNRQKNIKIDQFSNLTVRDCKQLLSKTTIDDSQQQLSPRQTRKATRASLKHANKTKSKTDQKEISRPAVIKRKTDQKQTSRPAVFVDRPKRKQPKRYMQSQLNPILSHVNEDTQLRLFSSDSGEVSDPAETCLAKNTRGRKQTKDKFVTVKSSPANGDKIGKNMPRQIRKVICSTKSGKKTSLNTCPSTSTTKTNCNGQSKKQGTGGKPVKRTLDLSEKDRKEIKDCYLADQCLSKSTHVNCNNAGADMHSSWQSTDGITGTSQTLVTNVAAERGFHQLNNNIHQQILPADIQDFLTPQPDSARLDLSISYSNDCVSLPSAPLVLPVTEPCARASGVNPIVGEGNVSLFSSINGPDNSFHQQREDICSKVNNDSHLDVENVHCVQTVTQTTNNAETFPGDGENSDEAVTQTTNNTLIFPGNRTNSAETVTQNTNTTVTSAGERAESAETVTQNTNTTVTFPGDRVDSADTVTRNTNTTVTLADDRAESAETEEWVRNKTTFSFTNTKPTVSLKQPTHIFECRVCRAKFSSTENLTHHMSKMSTGPETQCKLCQRTFHNSLDLNLHVFGEHEKRKKPFCFQCDNRFQTMEDFERHLHHHLWQQPPGLIDMQFHACRVCHDDVACRYAVIQTHYHTKHKMTTCLECFVRSDLTLLSDSTSAKKHRQSHANFCPLCLQDVPAAESVQTHCHQHEDCDVLQQREDGQGERCERCQHWCPNRASIYLHHKEHKLQVMRDWRQEKWGVNLACLHCDKVLRNKRNLQRHVQQMHCTQRSYTFHCEFCGKGADSRSNLKDHIALRHLGIQRYSCQFCPQRFSNTPSLRRHTLKSHAQDRQYICELCGKRFCDKFNLTRHMHVHSGEAALFVCEHCGKGFNQNSDFKKHRAVHAHKRDFVCTGCWQGYKRKEHLQRHIGKCPKAALTTKP